VVFVKFIEQGALVLHRPAFVRAKEELGSGNVFLCTFAGNAALVKALDVLPDAQVLLLDERGPMAFARSFFAALAACRRLGVDTAIDLEFFSRATAIFCYLSGARIRAGYHRYRGTETYRGNLFTHRLNYSHHRHVGQTGLDLLRAALSSPDALPVLPAERSPQPEAWRFEPTKAMKDGVQAMLAPLHNEGPLLVVCPNLCDPLPLRRWPEERYAGVITQLRREFPSLRTVLTGRLDEREETDAFIARHGLEGTLNLCGRTRVEELLTLIDLADLHICSDSGPGHFASVTDTHSIVLFGPETPVLYGPRSANTHLMYAGVACSPCFNVYNNRSSPCKDNICMKEITCEAIVSLAREILHEQERLR
jgi:ADP-heptose:LPS heptosyltransferase